MTTLEAVLSTGSTGSWHSLQASYLEQGPTDGWGNAEVGPCVKSGPSPSLSPQASLEATWLAGHLRAGSEFHAA